MCDIDDLFAALGRSEFRSRFKLGGKEAQYLMEKGLATILEHARDFVMKRLADTDPANDGRQTPMSNHPVFIAQHATATCCRKCLAKWHKIPKGRPLLQVEVGYIVRVIEHWLKSQDACVGASGATSNLPKV
ncbi:MAG TPA: DUF4186 domain-containing protein [bacterium]|nr:DUF4186 domain-containing protein [bacterium]